MGSIAKGNRSVKKAITHEQHHGRIVEKVERGGRFAKSKDLFAGLCLNCLQDNCEEPCKDRFSGFDLISLEKGKVNGVIRLIQVKTNTPAVQDGYKKFASLFAGKYLRVFVYTWYDRKGFRIQEYLKNKTIKETDLRK